MELNRPNTFVPRKNHVGQDWQRWKAEFKNYLKLSGAYSKFTEEDRALLLQNLMGVEAIKAMEKLSFDDPNDQNDMDILLMKFDEIFDPPSNEAVARYKFFSRRKDMNEDVENYVTDLREKASKCNFGNQTEKFIIDMIIRSMDPYLHNIIFAIEDITLQDILQQCKLFNINNEKIKELSEKNMARNLNSEILKGAVGKDKVSSEQSNQRSCWRCGTQHAPGTCPAYGYLCRVCFKKGHYEGLCDTAAKRFRKSGEKDPKPICSKCGENHPYKQCPAHDETCNNCSMKGHYTHKCKQVKLQSGGQKPSNEQANLKPLMNNFHQMKEPQSHVNTIKCFNCKRNPHDINCCYRTMVLPGSSSVGWNNDNRPAEFQPADPLLRNYVQVNQPPAYSSQSDNQRMRQNHPNNSTSRKTFNSKKNEKSDSCSIS